MITETQIDSALQGLFKDLKFKEEPSGLYEPLEYTLAIGGKRLRPRLCLTTYSIYKDEFDESILEPAAGIEVFHSFTLIHDDIMDKSPVRRGKPSVLEKMERGSSHSFRRCDVHRQLSPDMLRPFRCPGKGFVPLQ